MDGALRPHPSQTREHAAGRPCRARQYRAGTRRTAGYASLGAMIGRDAELAAIRGLLDGARLGHGAALVLYGEPGIGKSALLDAAAEMADGMSVLRCVAVESETELAFAGLHQLVWPLLKRLDNLPPEQAAAMRGAIGLGPPSGDRLLVAIALLTLLADAAEDRWSH